MVENLDGKMEIVSYLPATIGARATSTRALASPA
jgi:hypothetical protein